MKISVSIPTPRAQALERIAIKAFAGNRSAAVDAALDPLFREHGEFPEQEDAHDLALVMQAFHARREAIVEAARRVVEDQFAARAEEVAS